MFILSNLPQLDFKILLHPFVNLQAKSRRNNSHFRICGSTEQILRLSESENVRFCLTRYRVLVYNYAMNDNIEYNIAANIKELRTQAGLTQAELGEKIAYSDKTVSKWENGSSVPDITALCALAEVFNVAIDDLVKEGAFLKRQTLSESEQKSERANDIAMICLSVISVYMVATFTYVGLLMIKEYNLWQLFVWAVAPSALIVYRFNRINGGAKWVNAVTLSVFMWSLITALYLQLLKVNNFWPMFFIGAPLQAMIIISTMFRKRKGWIGYLLRPSDKN